ncbi:MAG: translation elongation factor Ts [Opitutales bacterium]
MAEITTKQVAELRAKTGAGLIDCKRALTESGGDSESAIDILRKKGVATAAKKAGREAGEGIIAQCLSEDGRSGVLVEVNCETDFVAKNEEFQAFAAEIAAPLLNDPNADLEEMRASQVAKTGENIKIARSELLSVKGHGVVQSYVHTGAKVAVLLSVTCDSEDQANQDESKLLAKDLCMQVAATNPLCVCREEMSPDLIEKEKEIAEAQTEGKPPQAVEKIIAGKLDKFYATNCLLEQSFVKNPDQTISELIQSHGSGVSVNSFARFQIGE